MGIDKERYCNLEELYVEFEKLVYVFIKDYTCEEHTIKDISQIVWLKVWRNLDKFQNMEKSDVKNYLRAISRNSVADHFKEKRKEKDILDEIGYLCNNIEIGELLELSDSSVRGRLKRILEKLENEIMRIQGRDNKHGK